MKLLFIFLLWSQNILASPIEAGGPDTIDDQTFDAFKNPYPSLSPEVKSDFSVGHSFFTNAWVSAPSTIKTRDGLGPTFNSAACAGCHHRDGRGNPYLNNTIQPSLLFRISALTDNVWQKDENYGDQINPFGIPGVPHEAKPQVSFKERTEKYEDGTEYSLRTPIFTFSDLSFGPLAKGIQVSPRVAPQMVGLGLIENIKAEDILSQEDPDDKNNDGVSGRANWPIDIKTNKPALGRFGWKANQPSLEQQNAGAFLGDMGLTTSLFPNENCPKVQVDCAKAPTGGDPEVTDEIFQFVLLYTRSLAVPKVRSSDMVVYESGLNLFKQVNCNSCHTPTYKTGKSEVKAMSEVDIFPFSDFLLHDMGDELADNRPDHLANGNEWRTPPLWALGLIETVNGHTFYLHDGRARNVEEAILWHGGEAKSSRDKFKQLSKANREELINFVKAL